MKTKFKGIGLLAAALSITIALTACGGGGGGSGSGGATAPAGGEAQAPEVIRLQLGHDNVPGEPLTDAGYFWAERLYEVSGGTMIIDHFHSTALGPRGDLLDRLFAGDAVMVMAEGGLATDFGVPDMGITMGPFLFNNWDQVNRLVASDLWEDLHTQMADVGMTIVGDNWQYGARSTLSIDRLGSLADFENLNIRVPNNTVQVEGMLSLGANPVTMGLGEVYSALQQGVFDAVENPLDVLIAHSFYEPTNYLLNTRHVFQIHFIVINTDLFNSFTPEQQRWLVETGTEAGILQNELMMVAEEEGLRTLADRGIEVINLTDSQRNEFQEAGRWFFTESSTAGNWTPGLYERLLSIID